MKRIVILLFTLLGLYLDTNAQNDKGHFIEANVTWTENDALRKIELGYYGYDESIREYRWYQCWQKKITISINNYLDESIKEIPVKFKIRYKNSWSYITWHLDYGSQVIPYDKLHNKHIYEYYIKPIITNEDFVNEKMPVGDIYINIEYTYNGHIYQYDSETNEQYVYLISNDYEILRQTEYKENNYIIVEYNNETGNEVTLTNGVKIKCLKEGKEITKGHFVYNDYYEQFNFIKISNGAQNLITMPDNLLAKGVKFYSYINVNIDKYKNEIRDCYWKEVNGIEYTSDCGNGLMENFKYNNDVNDYEYPYYVDISSEYYLGGVSSFTFTNAGYQPCLVMLIELENSDTSISNHTFNISNDNSIYNLSGQKVDENYKGIVIRNKRKMIQ